MQLLLKGSNFDPDNYHIPFQNIDRYIYELRDILLKNNIANNLLPKTSYEFINHLFNNKYPCLKNHQEEIDKYKSAFRQSDNLLGLACANNKSFVLTYFEYKYLHKHEDLEYIPNMTTTLKAIAEYKDLEIIISKPDENTVMKKDNCNSCSNPKGSIHINVLNNTVITRINTGRKYSTG